MAQLGTLEYDYSEHTRPNAGDERLAIRFFRKAKENPDESVKAGRPIFIEQDYIHVMVPGDRNSAHVRPVRPSDLIRFQKQYDHWKQTQSNEMVAGTPIDVLGLTLAQVEEYRYFGVRTVEQMAALRDDVVGKLMGAQKLKDKAKAYLEIIKSEAPIKQMNAELEKRDNQIATLTTALEEQAAEIKKLREEMGGKKGR